MNICGLKLTHDGSIALIADGKLIFSMEMEKLNNNERYTGIEELSIIPGILKQHGCDVSDVDIFAVDGWGGTDKNALAIQPRLEIANGFNRLAAFNNKQPIKFNVAPYHEETLKHDVMEEWQFSGLNAGPNNLDYVSYLHAAGHIIGTYCSSPIARRKENSYILVWDGGMYPRLYYFDVETAKVENLGPIFLLIGNIYTIFSQHFGPFKVEGNFAKDNLSVAGKVMAYVALGKTRKELFEHFDYIYSHNYNKPMGFANFFANEFKKKIAGRDYPDEDILRTFHDYLEQLLIEKLEKKIKRFDRNCRNLCLTGGCALNIKWNSAIRDTGLFAEVYTPPFPNDSGSGIGAACCAMVKKEQITALEWNVYSGPPITRNSPDAGWISREYSLAQLAKLLHETGEPVVFLNGNAELGPRALGNRSILAAPVSAKMKDILNQVKKREYYRPVSPICLEKEAEKIFDPGTRDPYMLFDHKVRKEWVDKIPAVLHLDGTARLQTLAPEENHAVGELLLEYQKISGIPLLCNTSANVKGCGFFPDVYSASHWGKVNYVWCDHILYEKEDKVKF